MSEQRDPHPVRGSDGAPRDPAIDSAEFERLRRLLLASEQDRLAAVDRRLAERVTADDISRVLPDSVARSARESDRLEHAFSLIFDGALSTSIKRHRQRFADALAPAMGPAIRRAVAEALRTMVESFNQVTQQSLSGRALRWRFEAWRTGRPFAEVVLSHSLVYRVEQVFLVHRETGLLLRHVAADPALAGDGDLVSGMLTAIRDFVHDSFAPKEEGSVDTMRVGDLTVWVEQGRGVYLASVVRGIPPPGLRVVMREALERVEIEFGEAIEGFQGDNAPFEPAGVTLQDCLRSEVRRRGSARPWLVPGLIAAAVLLALAVWGGFQARDAVRWRAYVDRLSSAPGLVVVDESRGWFWASRVAGLRDPDGANPALLAEGTGVDPLRVRGQWRPFVSAEAEVVAARARKRLQAPAGVALRVDDGVLRVTGRAPHAWCAGAEAAALRVPGVAAYDASGLVDTGLAAVAEAARGLEPAVVRFAAGSAAVATDQVAALDGMAASVKVLGEVAAREGVGVVLEVVGGADATGTAALNARLSLARAEGVAAALRARGVLGERVAVRSLGAAAAGAAQTADEAEAERARRRTVRVRLAGL